MVQNDTQHFSWGVQLQEGSNFMKTFEHSTQGSLEEKKQMMVLNIGSSLTYLVN